MHLASELAVVPCDLRTRAATAGMTEKRQVLALRQPDIGVHHVHDAELDEVIAAAARAELRPRAILQASGERRDTPIGVHDVVLSTRLERSADAESRLALERVRQPCLIVGERTDGKIE